jgi:hypothetical protein
MKLTTKTIMQPPPLKNESSRKADLIVTFLDMVWTFLDTMSQGLN